MDSKGALKSCAYFFKVTLEKVFTLNCRDGTTIQDNGSGNKINI
ncbi:hypothetical protein FHS86_001842 [Roseimarinus sediminis]